MKKNSAALMSSNPQPRSFHRRNRGNLLIELVQAINSGDILRHYQRTHENTTETSIEEFAQGFAAAYKAQQ